RIAALGVAANGRLEPALGVVGQNEFGFLELKIVDLLEILGRDMPIDLPFQVNGGGLNCLRPGGDAAGLRRRTRGEAQETEDQDQEGQDSGDDQADALAFLHQEFLRLFRIQADFLRHFQTLIRWRFLLSLPTSAASKTSEVLETIKESSWADSVHTESPLRK